MFKNLMFGAAMALLGAVTTAAAAPVAYVHELTGTATARVGTAAARALQTGDTLDQGTTITTGEKSLAVIKFEDGQLVVLQQRTTFVVSQYNYIPNSVKDSSIVFSLISGTMRFVTGVIGSTNRNAVRINAGTATIGIRGTDGVVSVDAVTAIVTAAVNAGAVALGTSSGTTDVGTAQFASAGATGARSEAAAIAAATPAVAQTLASLATVELPVNTPVVVAASAAAAAAKAKSDAAAAKAAAAPNDPVAKAEADAAKAAADAALAAAVTAAQAALAAALQGGAVMPASPALSSGAPRAPGAPTETPQGGGSGCTVSCN